MCVRAQRERGVERKTESVRQKGVSDTHFDNKIDIRYAARYIVRLRESERDNNNEREREKESEREREGEGERERERERERECVCVCVCV